MATIVVPLDTPTRALTANRALTVTVDIRAAALSLYVRINGGPDFKIVHGTQTTFDVVKNDVVDVAATGAGSVTVTTV